MSIRQSIDSNARAQLNEQLLRGERVLQRLLAQNAQVLRQGAALLAADYGFRDAVQSEDTATIRSALDNHGARIHAQVSALLDVQLGLRATSLADSAELRAVLRSLVAAGQNQPSSALAVLDGQGYQFVAVPMKAPVLVGWVVMGFAVDRELAEDLKALSGLQVALLERAAAQPLKLRTATLPPDAWPALAAAPATATELALADDRLAVRRVALLRSAAGDIDALLGRSISEAVAPFHRLQSALALITVAGMLFFGLGSVFTARRVTRPVRQLVAASRRLGAGDFITPVPQTGRDDEIGDLALAFDGMRTDLAARTQQISRLAYWDTLTGLPNRVQFVQQLADSLAAGGAHALLLLNLDRLGRVNQSLGRSCGDALLQCAAQRLAALPLQPPPFVARLTGDEFALLLRGHDLAQAQAAARSVAQAFEQPLSLGGSAVDLSAGMGLACAPQQADTHELLLDRAQLALDECKRRSSGLMVYEASLDAGNDQTLSLLGELRQALRHNELRLYLQPKLGLASGTVVGAEALVRWQHPTRGLVPPVKFIPFAEETGFIHELSLWVVGEAARVSALFREQGLQLRLSVNLSAHDLMKPDLPQRIHNRVQQAQLPASALCLEITESAIALDPQRALQTLHALKAQGYKLSIDDFGAGYTSLAQLTTLPVDELKIDMLFVRTMDKDADKASMVRSIIGLAHDRQLSVVAEGVENEAILAQLRALGADEAQGWHTGKPMPAEDLPGWLQARAVATPNPALQPA